MQTTETQTVTRAGLKHDLGRAEYNYSVACRLNSSSVYRAPFAADVERAKRALRDYGK